METTLREECRKKCCAGEVVEMAGDALRIRYRTPMAILPKVARKLWSKLAAGACMADTFSRNDALSELL